MNKQEQIKKLQRIYLERARAANEKYVNGPTDREVKQLEKGLSMQEQIKTRLLAAHLYHREMSDFGNDTIAAKIEKEIRILEIMEQNPNMIPQIIEKFQQPKDMEPTHNMVSDLKVCSFADKYYIGREQYHAPSKEWNPVQRVSPHYDTLEEANHKLSRCNDFKDIIKDITEDNLKVTAKSLMEREDEDPYNRMKAALIADYLRYDRQPEKELVEEHTLEIER